MISEKFETVFEIFAIHADKFETLFPIKKNELFIYRNIRLKIILARKRPDQFTSVYATWIYLSFTVF